MGILKKIFIKEVVAPFLIIVGSIVIYQIANKIINNIFKIKIKNVDSKKQNTLRTMVKNIVKYFIIIIASLMILDVFGIDTKTLVASFGIVGLVVGLALQSIIKDFLSGMTIIFENQYSVGDIVTITGFKGEVIELGMKTTKIKSENGDVKIIPNGNINEVINHSLIQNKSLEKRLKNE